MPEYSYCTDDVKAEIVAQLLELHHLAHFQPYASAITSARTKAENVKPPTISARGTSEEWACFNTRWGEHAQAIGISGETLVMQLLECYDDDLRRGLTRWA